jgi:hypothetical protein
MAASIAMRAMTTSSSISVKPFRGAFFISVSFDDRVSVLAFRTAQSRCGKNGPFGNLDHLESDYSIGTKLCQQIFLHDLWSCH